MKEGDPATHARIHFLMDHTQVFVVFSFFLSQMTNCPFLGEGRETVTAAVANGIDELLNKGNQSLLQRSCQLSTFFVVVTGSSLSSQVIPHRRNHVTVSFHLSHVILSYVTRMSSITCHLSPSWAQRVTSASTMWNSAQVLFCSVTTYFQSRFFSMHQYYVALSYD